MSCPLFTHLFLFITLLVPNASAEPNGQSEYLFQPFEKGFAISAFAGMESMSEDGAGAFSEFTNELNQWALNTQIQYGVKDWASLGLSTGYIKRKEQFDVPSEPAFNTQTESSGWIDPQVNVDFRFASNPSSFRVGVELLIPVGEKEINLKSNPRESTVTEGRTEVTLRAGFVYELKSHFMGVEGSYQIVAGEFDQYEQDITGESQRTFDGGVESQFNIFYEYHFQNKAMAGVSVESLWVTETTESSTADVYTPAISQYTFKTYTRYRMSPQTSFLGHALLGQVNSFDYGNIEFDSGVRYGFKAGVRFEFQ